MEFEDTTQRIIGAAIRVHRRLGPGLLESAYRACLAVELQRRGLDVLQEVPIPLIYEGTRIDSSYRLDLLVGGEFVVELKAVEKLNPVHIAQLITYLRLSRHRVGLLMNFNVTRLKDGIRRVVVGPPGSTSVSFVPFVVENQSLPAPIPPQTMPRA